MIKSQISNRRLYIASKEGVSKHIARWEQTTSSIKPLTDMKAAGVSFQDTSDTYYDLVDRRLPGHGEAR